MLNLDLMLLRDPTRFEDMCFRLVRYEFPHAMRLASSWDGGRDIVIFDHDHGCGDVVFQCKFIEDLSAAKTKIKRSLDALATNQRRTERWVLCLPVDPSGAFMNWLNAELDHHSVKGFVWGKSELIFRLEQHRDVIENFFSSTLAELSSWFHTENIELFKLALDHECQWDQPDPGVLHFCARPTLKSPDLVLDVILRNKAIVADAVMGIQAEVFDRHVKMHGIPGDGLLFPQITYVVSVQGGKVGAYYSECDPPLVVRPKDLERFKIRIVDTGYAWNGGLRVSLSVGGGENLSLPAMRLFI